MRRQIVTPYRLYVAVAAVAAAAVLTLPAIPAFVLYNLMGVAAGVTVIVATRRRRPAAPAAWYLLGGSLLAFSLWTILGDVLPALFHVPPVPHRDLLAVAGYAQLFVAFAILVRRRAGGISLDLAIDTIAFVGSVTAVGVVVIVLPALEAASGHGAHIGGTAGALGLGISVLQLGFFARCVMLPGRRPPALRLLMVAMAAGATGDVLLHGTILSPSKATFEMAIFCYVLFYLVVGAAAMHPSAVEVGVPAPVKDKGISPTRLVALGVALVLGPLVLALQAGIGSGPTLVLGILLPAGTTVLLLARILLLVRQKDAARDEVARQERYFRTLAANAGDLVDVCDGDGVVRFRSPSATAVLGVSTDPGGHVFDDVDPEDREAAVALLAHATRVPNALVAGEVRLRHADGRSVWFGMRVVNLLDDPDVGGVVVVREDISVRKELEAELRHNAFHDALTGLPNRAMIFDRITNAINRAKRSDGRIGVVFVDLDDFKKINDTMGHAAGDTVLREVADRLSRAVRPGDTLARLGGDEFAVLVENVTLDELHGVGARLLDVLRPGVECEGVLFAVGASIGLSLGTGDDTAGELLREADVAMYSAKGQGKGAVALYEGAAA